MPKCVVPDDAHCENLFVSTSMRQHGGRYYNSLAVYQTFFALGTNRKSGNNAFSGLERRLSADEEAR